MRGARRNSSGARNIMPYLPKSETGDKATPSPSR